MNRIMAFIKDFLNYKGRANREKFLIRSLAILLLWLAITMISIFLRSHLPEDIFFPIFGILFIFLAISGLCNTIRRCHDLNYSGFVAFLALTIPVLLTTILPLFIVSLFNISITIYLLSKRGTVGENQYGPDPLQAE